MKHLKYVFYGNSFYNLYVYFVELNSNLSELIGWMPYSNSLNVEFTNGVGYITITGKTITKTALAVWGVWIPDFNGVVSAEKGRIKINGYIGSNAATGVQWVALSGLFKVK